MDFEKMTIEDLERLQSEDNESTNQDLRSFLGVHDSTEDNGSNE